MLKLNKITTKDYIKDKSLNYIGMDSNPLNDKSY